MTSGTTLSQDIGHKGDGTAVEEILKGDYIVVPKTLVKIMKHMTIRDYVFFKEWPFLQIGQF